MAKFGELVEVIETLRGPNGCAWKKRLSLKTLPPYSREEFEELMQAIEKEDWENLKEELGDVLFHVVMYCQIAKEQGRFTAEDVLGGIIEKMKRRNPHVYGNLKITDPDEIEKMWEELKKKEKLGKQEKKKERKVKRNECN